MAQVAEDDQLVYGSYPIQYFKTCGRTRTKKLKLPTLAAHWARAAYDDAYFAAYADSLDPRTTAALPRAHIEAVLNGIGSSRIMSNHLRQLFPPLLAALVHLLKAPHFRQALHGIIKALTLVQTRPVFASLAGLNLPCVLSYVKDPEAIWILKDLFFNVTLQAYIEAFHDRDKRDLLPVLVENVSDPEIGAFTRLLAGFEPYRFECADWHGDPITMYSTPPQIALIKHKSLAVVKALADFAPREAMAPLTRSAIWRNRVDVLQFLVYQRGFLIPQDGDAECYTSTWLSTSFQTELHLLGMHCVRIQLHALCHVGHVLGKADKDSPVGLVLGNGWLMKELAGVFLEHLVPVKKPKEQKLKEQWYLEWANGGLEDALVHSLMYDTD